MMQAKRENTKFWHANDLGEHIELLHATYFTHSFTPHIHEGYAFGVIERGAEEFDYRRGHCVAPAGSVVIIHPGEMHTGNAVADETGWVYRMFYPDVTLMQKAVQDFSSTYQPLPFFESPVIWDHWLFQQIQYLHRLLETSASALERESHLLWTVRQLVERHGDLRLQFRPLRDDRNAVNRVKDYLQAHYTKNITLDELSQVACLSPYHLNRVFRQAMGLPPHSYVIQLRVNRAKALLSQRLAISDVALATGFTDQSHLTRHFKRIVGVPPGQYRHET